MDLGSALNTALKIPKELQTQDIEAAQNYNALRNWLYLDIAVYGHYNPIKLIYASK